MMRLFIPDLETKTGGPGSFFRCLVPALGRVGVKASGGLGFRADLALVSPFCRTSMLRWIRARGLPIVQRLDGIHYGHTSRFNENMRRVYVVAHAVIFQSEFSRRICQGHFGDLAAQDYVIKNGTDLSVFYPSDNIPDVASLRLVASSLWRPQKRLRDCLEILSAIRCIFPDATLRVLGDTSRVPSEVRMVPGVSYLGDLPRHEVALVLRENHLFLHPSWFDPCPNAVVEALASGLPVLHTRNGGTRELVHRGCGIELANEPDFDLREMDIYNYDRIPRVDTDEAVKGIIEIMANYSSYRRRIAEHRPLFGIDIAAREYQRVFAECLNLRLAVAHTPTNRKR